MAKFTLTVDTAATIPGLTVVADNKAGFIVALQNYLGGVASGAYSANMIASNGAVQAFATLTNSGQPGAGEQVILAGTTLSAVSGVPAANQFQIGANAAGTYDNLVTLINSTAAFTNVVTAARSGTVVTITSVVPGIIGNQITLSESLANCALGNVTSGKLSSGADANRKTYVYGRS